MSEVRPTPPEDDFTRRRREYRIGRVFSVLVAAAGLVLLLLGDTYLGGAAATSGAFFAVLYGYLLRRLEERGR